MNETVEKSPEAMPANRDATVDFGNNVLRTDGQVIPPGRTACIGRIVHYVLTQEDADRINSRRGESMDYKNRRDAGTWCKGAQPHWGSSVGPGEHVAAMVTRTHFLPENYAKGISVLNLKCMLDGNDDYWVINVAEGIDPGTWHWPELR